MQYVTAQPVAREGVLDLREYDFHAEGAFRIRGEWNFYWEKLINPLNYKEEGGVPVPVPAAWKRLGDQIPGIGPKGYGSYNLKILVPDNPGNLAMRFTEVFSGSGYYVNGKNIGFNGFPGTNRFQTVFGYAPKIYIIQVKDTLLDLVVHVTNFDHRSGGIRGDIEIGTPMQIMSHSAERQYQDFFMIGAILFIGIYFMWLFLIRGRIPNFVFSLICLIMALRIFILSDAAAMNTDLITGVTRLRLEYLTFYLLVPAFVVLIRVLFPHDFSIKFFNQYSGLLL